MYYHLDIRHLGGSSNAFQQLNKFRSRVVQAMFSIFLVSFSLQLAYAEAEIKEGKAPVIIVDGMDWRVLKSRAFNTPNFNFIAQTGVKAEYLKNVVPSLTWPNHAPQLFNRSLF